MDDGWRCGWRDATFIYREKTLAAWEKQANCPAVARIENNCAAPLRVSPRDGFGASKARSLAHRV
jgi:hypothetical protein